MKLNIKKSIEENIITVDISVAELGTEESILQEEYELLHDFPRTIRFSDIDFKSNMKLDSNGNPIVTLNQLMGQPLKKLILN